MSWMPGKTTVAKSSSRRNSGRHHPFTRLCNVMPHATCQCESIMMSAAQVVWGWCSPSGRPRPRGSTRCVRQPSAKESSRPRIASDSPRGSSVNIGTIRRNWAWPLRKESSTPRIASDAAAPRVPHRGGPSKMFYCEFQIRVQLCECLDNPQIANARVRFAVCSACAHVYGHLSCRRLAAVGSVASIHSTPCTASRSVSRGN